jgi:hypothetical protein
MQVSVESIVESDVVWGAKAIGLALGLTERQAFHRLEAGQIPGARKVGRTWAASKCELRRMFAADAA